MLRAFFIYFYQGGLLLRRFAFSTDQNSHQYRGSFTSRAQPYKNDQTKVPDPNRLSHLGKAHLRTKGKIGTHSPCKDIYDV